MEKEYYYITLSHSRAGDNVFQFWKSNHNGYTKAYENAGVYNEPYGLSKVGELYHEQLTVDKELVDGLIVELKLGEDYAGLNNFHVLPNIGKVRKALGITVFDFRLDGENNSFCANFKDEIYEKTKVVRSDDIYHVKAKTHVSEFWYLDGMFEAENRNKAILKAFKEWIPMDYDTYLDFKKDVTCSKKRETVFDGWSS